MEKQKFKLSQEESRSFYRRMFALVLPLALQNLINVGVTTADVVMLGRVGETVLSASSLANQIYFILNLIFFGMTSGAMVLTAQYWGKRDVAAIEKVLGIAMGITMVIAVVFTAVTLCVPAALMKIFTSEEAVIAEGVVYLRIVAWSYVLSGITMVYLYIMRSVEKVMISTCVYLISLIVNIGLNAIFIFGLLGCPAMGIAGAALGTLIARIVELLIVIWYAKFKNREVRFRFRYMFRFDRLLLKDFIVYSIPVMINELLWGAGMSAIAAIIGHLGSPVVAANSVAQVCRQLATVVAFGLSSATAIMIGKAIGEGKYDFAEAYARKCVKLGILFGIAGSGVIQLLRPVLWNYLSLTDEAFRYLSVMLFVMAYFIVAQAYNTTLVVGVFRGGGDIKYGLFLDAVMMWCGSIFGGFLAAFVFHLPIPIVYMILVSDEVLKLPFSTWRFRSKKWLKNVTRD
ncbi:MATE family efflux transporter [Diplocloster agilis]|uniref:MATE family efflux transporter n=1 Tax=Diplocloster agilis TaxID=2850323 RepID=UPI000821BA29|nr:MATE family efflux transporter [Suonthocola fibrivorans]MCU6733622.1 MATE family efflux transporter [Suonthocola fibrivorans]SCJ00383.1 Multidrug-efflux transporter [uncultured Clostridium sp.]